MGALTLLVLALAAGCASLSSRITTREARAMAAYPPQGQFIDVQGHRVHVVERGQTRGSAPDLVLIHGSNGSSRDMTFRLSPALEDAYHILIFDRPGLGYSDPVSPTGTSIQTQAEILQAASAQLGVSRPIVLGQSYGGAVALAWATQFPEHTAAVVNVSGVSHPWEAPLPAFYQLTSSRLGGQLVVPLLTALVPKSYVRNSLAEVFAPQEVPKGFAEHFGLEMSLRRSSLRANARQRANLLSEVEAMAPQYPDLTMPIEIVHGTADTTVGISIHAERLVADTSTARLTPLDGVGHMPHQTHTEAVVNAVHRAAQRAGLR
ncbi:alpha/beta hydrolase [Epibacterium sp. MM17-32]|uniref:alpha/beta fold hydrolase n=1 Tax=Epibacterium sp. MM17-32 TaxID=2917734 RepID=UPI001EF6BACF|nr:alpha/beta hydrolase [Epibacterium sp. MM17-32]MCG7626405.1 alpha/beta hydrolase [Epibacterium sp. MM17-32]